MPWKVGAIFVLLVLASGAPISRSFICEVQRHPLLHAHVRTRTMVETLTRGMAALHFSKMETADDGGAANAPKDDSCASIDDIDMLMVKDYEYLHPDIAALLLTEASKDESKVTVTVDPSTLTLCREPNRQNDLKYTASDTMAIDLLARLADECDCAVFGEKKMQNHTIPKKISGLICLSKLSSPSRSMENGEGKHEWQKPAILVATMIALNLLESSIRSTVRRYSDKNKTDTKAKSNNKCDVKRNRVDLVSKSQTGAPLLKDMIEQISNMDDFALDADLSESLSEGCVLSASDLAPILRALLLPTKAGGINLRNLVSHGFLSIIDRQWFSVTLVLIQTLDSLLISNTPFGEGLNIDDDANRVSEEANSSFEDKTNDQDHGMSSITKYEPMAWEVQNGKCILLHGPLLQELERQAEGFISSSYMPLLSFGLQVLVPTLQHCICPDGCKERYTTNTAALDQENDESLTAPPTPPLTGVLTTLFCSLLEHSLRILWCEVNSRPSDRMARPSEYYVTLDGHGQRDKHEVVITPYLQDGVTRNQIIPVIGPKASSMLSDLFSAPSIEAPNIRSAICHGSWDVEIVKELEGLALTGHSSVGFSVKSNQNLLDSACAITSCLNLISSNMSEQTRLLAKRDSYRPVYTYTSTAVRNLNDIFQSIEELDLLISRYPSISSCIRTIEQQQPKLRHSMKPLNIELRVIQDMACDLFPTMKKEENEFWTIDDIYSEHQTNMILAGNIAALALLSDASYAIKKYLSGIQDRIGNLSMIPSNTKDRRTLKTTARFCSAAMIAREFYTFCVYVALVAIRHDSKKALNGANNDDQNEIKRDDAVRAVERSRMTMSTFDSHLTTNLDRSLKSLQNYLQGKAIKCFMNINGDKQCSQSKAG